MFITPTLGEPMPQGFNCTSCAACLWCLGTPIPDFDFLHVQHLMHFTE